MLLYVGGDELNLITDRWIPALRDDGNVEKIAPWQITDQKNPIIRVAGFRPDSEGAMAQFLIGVVQTTCPPVDDRDWERRFREPPAPDDLRSAMGEASKYFELTDLETPFMQVAGLSDGVAWPIQKLFLEQPGRQTITQNRDLFQRRDTVTGVCPACAAAALYTLQSTGPAGGGGHLTGIRGGGPLTCIVMGDTLWETVWLNVLNRGEFEELGNVERNDPAGMYPWVPPIRGRERFSETTPDDVHPANLYWGMPRQILLDPADEPGVCSICGETVPARITGFAMKKWGVNYAGPWRHPLTPYYRSKGDEWLPEHAQPGGVYYKHWLGIVQSDPVRDAKAPLSASAFRRRWERVEDLLPRYPLLWTSGYDMDNSKARCWYEGVIPLIAIPGGRKEEIEGGIADLVRTADLVRYSAVTSVRTAHSSPKTKNKVPAPAEVSARFWGETDALFYAAVAALIADDGGGPEQVKRQWLRDVSRVAENLFDYYSQATRIGGASYPQRIAEARRDLRTFTSPKNKKIRETLGLPEERKENGR